MSVLCDEMTIVYLHGVQDELADPHLQQWVDRQTQTADPVLLYDQALQLSLFFVFPQSPFAPSQHPYTVSTVTCPVRY